MTQSREINPNPWCKGWVPQTHKSLFETSLGFEQVHYHLIDWDTGKELWNIPAPGNAQTLSIALSPEFAIFVSAEYAKPEAWSGSSWILEKAGQQWIRTFYAVRIANGSIAARWQAEYPRQFEENHANRLLCLRGKLYFLTDDEFVEISLDDIREKKNGWK